MTNEVKNQSQRLYEYPNRQVGDRSRQPTAEQPAESPGIPQPAGWGSFTPAYRGTAGRLSGNTPTGRLGIVHASLLRSGDLPVGGLPVGVAGLLGVGWNEISPTFRLGDYRRVSPRGIELRQVLG